MKVANEQPKSRNSLVPARAFEHNDLYNKLSQLKISVGAHHRELYLSTISVHTSAPSRIDRPDVDSWISLRATC